MIFVLITFLSKKSYKSIIKYNSLSNN